MLYLAHAIVEMQRVLIPGSEVDVYVQRHLISAVVIFITVTLAHMHVHLCVAREIIAFLKRYTGTRAVRLRIVREIIT